MPMPTGREVTIQAENHGAGVTDVALSGPGGEDGVPSLPPLVPAP
jgi:hypothetical protein